MFLPPGFGGSSSAADDEEKRLRTEYTRVEGLVKARIPDAMRSAAEVHVQEVQCGDPSCAPIDCAIIVMFDSGGRGQFGIPCESREVGEEELDEFCPPVDVFTEWYNGNSVEWSPFQDDEYDMNDEQALRFRVGTLVQCRVGADPVTGWANGHITELFYRENNWPPGQMAPYKVALDDGRNIFAPQDIPEVIRARPV
ncbi:hypothetical protein TrVE_jg12774 [Triparma verrucosa]|uniref:Uncharacterized protein n=2 Tax=Triparma TaxID=722752 RepID=A0A9W7E3X2_9STRA|nr:hypothetical protein TrST_g9539 [Triparma strigata]GMI05979.1 hypothetical protein TrVE_jg12774 [Triparma verrucosa]